MTRLWPGIVALLAALAFGLAQRGALPAEVATHWNIHGEADGWSSPLVAVVLLPAIGLLLAAFLVVLPRFDPKRANFPLHEKAWWLLGNTLLVFMGVLQLFVIGVNLGWPVRIDQVLGIGLGALLVVLGNYLSRVRQNWFMGIRTPWTLSSERSWRETHRLGGRLFMLGGLLLLILAAVQGRISPIAIILGAIVPAAVAVVWSYKVWRDDPDAEGRTP